MRGPTLFRLGLVAVVATIGLTTATGQAGADEPTASPPSTSAPSSSTPDTPPPSSEPSPPSSPAESSAPPASEPQGERRDVRLTIDATFAPDHYQTGDPLTATVTITNTGTDPATGLSVEENTSRPDRMVLDTPGWGALTGVTIAAGATHELVLTGRMTNPHAGLVTLTGTLRDGSGAAVPFAFEVDAHDVYGTLRGVMYRDQDGDGRFDPGEGRGGTELTLIHIDHPSVTHTVTTDAAGEFASEYVDTGTYRLATGSADGWHLSSPRRLTVVEGENDPIQVRTVRRSSALRATMAFERETYRRDEVAGLKVTLVNESATTLTGVKITCHPGPERNHLTGTGPGWTPLTPPGVTLAPGQTRTFRVTERVPEGAFRLGLVEARCDFTDDATAGADAADTAKVIGGLGVLSGNAFYRADDTWPEPPTNIRLLKNMRVVAVSGDRCPKYLETRTDDLGGWRIDRVPAGPYTVYAFPPPGIGLYPPPGAQVKHDETTVVTIEGFEDELATTPPLPEPPPGCAGPGGGPGPGGDRPAPQPKAGATGLAYTGASVVGIAAIGLAALLAGTGSVLATRRRKR